MKPTHPKNTYEAVALAGRRLASKIDGMSSLLLDPAALEAEKRACVAFLAPLLRVDTRTENLSDRRRVVKEALARVYVVDGLDGFVFDERWQVSIASGVIAAHLPGLVGQTKLVELVGKARQRRGPTQRWNVPAVRALLQALRLDNFTSEAAMTAEWRKL